MDEQKLQRDQAALRGMLGSPEAKKVLAQLKKADTARLQAAAQRALQGDTAALSGILQTLSQDADTARAVEALNQKLSK